jgi:hypothetical protein
VTVYYDNPAGRLHRVLTGLRQVSPGSVSLRDAWARILGVNEPSKRMDVLARRIVEVLQLPHEIDVQMQQIDDDYFDRDFAMRWWKPVQKTFEDALFSTAQVSQALHYDNEALGSLETCSYTLHRYRREALPGNDDLNSIRELLTEIEDFVATDGDIDAELAKFLLRHVRAMARAIDDFDIIGADAMEMVLNEALGASMRRGYIPNHVDEEESPDDTGSESAVKKFWKMLSRAAVVLSISANLLALGQAAHSGMTNTHPPAVENVVNVEELPLSGGPVIAVHVVESVPSIGSSDGDGSSN